MRIPIVREGFNLIKIFFCLGVGFWILARAFWPPLGWLSLVWAGTIIFCGFFFRDPKREIPRSEDLILSPADGKIIEISEESAGPVKVVKIFMSPFDVHITRAPVNGQVKEIKYTPGKFFPAYQREASRANEQNCIGIERVSSQNYSRMSANKEFAKVRVSVKQIAGIFARRIICWCKEEQNLTPGQKIGMIVLGSRVEISLPANVSLEVSNQQRVRAGQTIIGRWKR